MGIQGKKHTRRSQKAFGEDIRLRFAELASPESPSYQFAAEGFAKLVRESKALIWLWQIIIIHANPFAFDFVARAAFAAVKIVYLTVAEKFNAKGLCD